MNSSDATSPAQAGLNANGDSALPSLETLGKDEAAQFLGVSSRALERYTASGRVAVGYAPGKTRSVAVYERAEIEKLKRELQRPLLRGASVATSNGSPVAPSAGEQTPTTPTETSTSVVESPTEGEEDWDRQTRNETSTNSDSPSDSVSDELVAVSPGTSGGEETALHALTQLVLERLLERLQGEAGMAIASGSTGAGSTSAASTALVLAPAGPFVSKAPHVALGEKPLLTLPEAAALTGLSRSFLKSAIAGGSLVAKPIGRLWRVKRADLDAFIAAL